jgi:hypothetical protein
MKNIRLKRFSLAFVIVISIVIILNGCDTLGNRNITKPLNRSKWVEDLFTENICALPCWEGITPGKITVFEAYQMLESNSLYTSIEEPIVINVDPKKYEIIWKNKEGTAGGLARSLGDKNLIWVIYLSLTQENPKITLGEIISVFGEPDSLIIEEDRGICISKLFYIQKSMAIVFSDPCHLKLSIRKNQEIESIRLFPTDISNFPEVEYFQSNIFQYLLEWNGYGRYPITKIIKLE